jgi:hypothetical protein
MLRQRYPSYTSLRLGRAPPRCGQHARPAPARPPRPPPTLRRHPPRARDPPPAPGPPVPARPAPRARIRALTHPRRRAPRLPDHPLFLASDSRPPRGRGDGPEGPRARHEGAGDAARPSGAPGLRVARPGARGALSSASAADVAVVRRLGDGGADSARPEAGGAGADVAAARRVAAARPDLAGRRPGAQDAPHTEMSSSIAALVAPAACPGRAAAPRWDPVPSGPGPRPAIESG